MHEPSDEQQSIVDAVLEGNNVIVNAVAGSGKTTTMLHVARKRSAILYMFVYNRRLMDETKRRVKSLRLDHVRVYTFHSAARRFFPEFDGYTDQDMRMFLDTTPTSTLQVDDDVLVVVDEVQDMTPLYYSLLYALFRKRPLQWLILGDAQQSLYAYKGATVNYLRHAPLAFESDREWVSRDLSTSYRLTDSMANFLACCRGSPFIRVQKSGPRVQLIRTDPFDSCKKIFNAFHQLLNQGYQYQDIFVLSYSVGATTQRMTPVKLLAQMMTSAGIPIHAPSNDVEDTSPEVLKGKVAFCTFHQSKGRERPCVIAFGIDMGHFKSMENHLSPEVIPNTFYVALTRATDRLIVIQNWREDPLPLLDEQKVLEVCDVSVPRRERPTELSRGASVHRTVSVGQVMKNLSDETMVQCMELLEIESSIVEEGGTSIPGIIRDPVSGRCEEVSDINGSVVPIVFELWHTQGARSSAVEQVLRESKGTLRARIQRMWDEMPRPFTFPLKQSTVESLLFITTYYLSVLNGYDFKWRQIRQFTWFPATALEFYCLRLANELGRQGLMTTELCFEVFRFRPYYPRSLNITGAADVFVNDQVWEIKLKAQETPQDILQAVAYAWLLRSKTGSIVLYNLKNSHQYRITVTEEKRDEIIKLLLQPKTMEETQLDPGVFQQICLSERQRWLPLT